MPNQVYYADFIIYKEYSIIDRPQLPISFEENKLFFLNKVVLAWL